MKQNFKKVKFTHPYFDQLALDHQSKLKNLQNKRNILFCGSYFGYGFHEDGIKSSIEMLKSTLMTRTQFTNGTVIHKRFKPKKHYFKYRVFSLLIDLSDLNNLGKKLITFFLL